MAVRVCVEREMSFPARGNLRHVAIGGSKLAREYGAHAARMKRDGREEEKERGRSCAGRTRERKVRSR